jgi:crotonobetainyl-CoA:carnitine CoA-transferase CaiB-like acyl-CoA transferase
MSGPLEGTKVIEMANVISGPYAGMLLADLGAEVVKVEMPGSGDVFRMWDGDVTKIRPYFAAYNRGKRSVTLDVRTDEGREAFLRLAAGADVVVENFRPGVMDRFGLGYEAVREVAPEVVYCSVTGMGNRGPAAAQPVYDAVVQAVSGLWSQLTDMDDPEPVGPAISDQLTSLYAVQGILAALLHRERTGEGQHLHASMLAASMAFQTVPIADWTMEGRVADKSSRPRRSQSYAFRASDGRPLAIHLSTPQKFWLGLLRVVGRPELADDPRFGDKAGRIAHYDELHEILAEEFARRPRDEWLARLGEEDVPSAPINTIAEALDEPQVQAGDLVQTFGTGERAVDLVGFPVEFSASPCTPGLPPPEIGEHSDEVLAEAEARAEAGRAR